MNLHLNLTSRSTLAGLALVLACVPACGRGPHTQANDPNVPKAPQLKPVETVSALDEDMQVQPARTTSDAALTLPWHDVTATAGAPKPAAPRTWTGPAVLIGRKQVFLKDKALGPLHCESKKPEACTPEAAAQPSTVAQFGFAPDQIVDGKLAALVAVAAELKDQQVPVIADRRVTWQSVEAVLAAGSQVGDLVDALGVGSALPEAPTLTAARRAAQPGESGSNGLPADATSVTIAITSGGVSVTVARAEGEPVYPEVLGNIVESLIALADRFHMAFPKIDTITIEVDPDVAMERVIQVVDGLRDDCGRTNQGQRCATRVQLFSKFTIRLAGSTPEPVKVGLEAPLHVDAPPPSGLHLADPPAGEHKPEAGLHL